MQPEIKFGTAGWRGIIAKDFTCENVNWVSKATAEQFLEDLKKDKSLQNTVYVGYDRRFLGKEFAQSISLLLYNLYFYLSEA